MEQPQENFETQENLTFNDVVVALQDHLVVNKHDLEKFFHKLGWVRSGTSWYVKLLPGQTVIVGKKNGKSYKIGVQVIKELDQLTRSMQPRNLPIEIDRLDKGIPVGSASYGHRPDSFEEFPGVHPADK